MILLMLGSSNSSSSNNTVTTADAIFEDLGPVCTAILESRLFTEANTAQKRPDQTRPDQTRPD